MSTVKEIQAAIKALSKAQREKLVRSLPEILPELNGDEAWKRLISDPRPRPELSRLGDRIEGQLEAEPNSIAELNDRDFERHQ
jgi:hypothetical protein